MHLEAIGALEAILHNFSFEKEEKYSCLHVVQCGKETAAKPLQLPKITYFLNYPPFLNRSTCNTFKQLQCLILIF